MSDTNLIFLVVHCIGVTLMFIFMLETYIINTRNGGKIKVWQEIVLIIAVLLWELLVVYWFFDDLRLAIKNRKKRKSS